MKKIHFMIALILSCISIIGCGEKEEQKDSEESTQSVIQTDTEELSADTGETGYYDIFVEQEPIFQWELMSEAAPTSKKSSIFLGMQFYQGETVQLWGVHTIHGEFILWDIYCYREDGSREVLVESANPHYRHGYLDQEGNFYFWHNSYPEQEAAKMGMFPNASLQKFLPSGELVYEKLLDSEQDIINIRQGTDGRIYLTLHDRKTGDKLLKELEPDTGRITELCGGQPLADGTHSLDLGIYGENPVVLTDRIFKQINTDDSTEALVLSLKGTTYTEPQGTRKNLIMQDFRVLEDETVEILWSTSEGTNNICEKVRKLSVEKIPVIISTRGVDNWLNAQINSFNQSNETYHVIADMGTDDWEDNARLTSIQIASGKGPDILCGDLMQDYITGMMEKGVFEDLLPYMEESGIREEDYFPFTFAAWRDGGKIYGISPESPGLVGYHMDSEALGDVKEPDIETLVNVLLARQEDDAAFMPRCDSQKLLTRLLRGSDSLWGAIDWESGSCDFEGELFTKILETAKRYGDNGDSTEKDYLAESRSLYDVFHFDDLAERTSNGWVICGVLFDDGCHAAVESNSTLAINANSSNKEGAWEFISYLLGDEAQSASHRIPAGKKAFDIWLKKEKDRVADGKEITEMYGIRLPSGQWETTNVITYTADDITDEIVVEFVEVLEDARPYPLRTVSILEIISEEAEDYFQGSKSAEAVEKIIENRVQLYLDERQ